MFGYRKVQKKKNVEKNIFLIFGFIKKIPKKIAYN